MECLELFLAFQELQAVIENLDAEEAHEGVIEEGSDEDAGKEY